MRYGFAIALISATLFFLMPRISKDFKRGGSFTEISKKTIFPTLLPSCICTSEKSFWFHKALMACWIAKFYLYSICPIFNPLTAIIPCLSLNVFPTTVIPPISNRSSVVLTFWAFIFPQKEIGSNIESIEIFFIFFDLSITIPYIQRDDSKSSRFTNGCSTTEYIRSLAFSKTIFTLKEVVWRKKVISVFSQSVKSKMIFHSRLVYPKD